MIVGFVAYLRHARAVFAAATFIQMYFPSLPLPFVVFVTQSQPFVTYPLRPAHTYPLLVLDLLGCE